MNYLSIYNLIISRAQLESRRKRKHDDVKYVYYEKHHIIPKCIGGLDKKDNLILLTAREHFVAHQLLVKIYPNNHGLVFALRMMCRNNNKYHLRNNTEYEWVRRLHAEISSKSQKGKSYGFKFTKGHDLSKGNKNGMFGKRHTTETKQLQSEKALLRPHCFYDAIRHPVTDSHRENIRKAKVFRKYKLISADNVEYIFDTIKEAHIFCGVSTDVLIKIAGNRYTATHCRGWQCISILL